MGDFFIVCIIFTAKAQTVPASYDYDVYNNILIYDTRPSFADCLDHEFHSANGMQSPQLKTGDLPESIEYYQNVQTADFCCTVVVY